MVREDAKAAVLLHLLRCVLRPQDQTVVFVATKHHAEYLSEVRAPLRGEPQGGSSEPQIHLRPPEGSTRSRDGGPETYFKWIHPPHTHTGLGIGTRGCGPKTPDLPVTQPPLCFLLTRAPPPTPP